VWKGGKEGRIQVLHYRGKVVSLVPKVGWKFIASLPISHFKREVGKEARQKQMSNHLLATLDGH
jgi:hypothetical protein